MGFLRTFVLLSRLIFISDAYKGALKWIRLTDLTDPVSARCYGYRASILFQHFIITIVRLDIDKRFYDCLYIQSTSERHDRLQYQNTVISECSIYDSA